MEELKDEASRQGRSIFETSSVVAISAVRALPDRARWLSSSTRVGAVRTGKLFSAAILEDYSHTSTSSARSAMSPMRDGN